MGKKTGHKVIFNNKWRNPVFYMGIVSCFIAWAVGTFFGSYSSVLTSIFEPDIPLNLAITYLSRSTEKYHLYLFQFCILPILILTVGGWLVYYVSARKQNKRDIIVLLFILIISLIGGFVSGFFVTMLMQAWGNF